MEGLLVKDLITIFTMIGVISGASWRLSTLIGDLKTTLSTFIAKMEEKVSNIESNINKIDKEQEKIDLLIQRVTKIETCIKKSTLHQYNH